MLPLDGGTPPRRVSGVSAVACTDTRSRRHLRARGIGYCDGVSLGRPTIIDVARAAGTSKSVVSRVITGKGSVSADARARVVAAMAQLGYRSNPAARTLQSGRSGSVGVLLRNVTSAFYCTLFTSLQRLASVDGSRVVGATGNMIQGSERAALDNLLHLGVDALIIGSGTMPIRTITRVSERIPTVVLTRPVPDTAASAVYDDPGQHALYCVGALWEAGHRDIALFDAKAFSAQPRIQAIRREANERGMRVHTVSAGYDLQPGMEAARVWLAGARQETGLLFLGFEAAVGAMYELGQAGVSVPDDVSVVAADAFHLPNPFSPDVAGSSRDQKLFAEQVWLEVTARLDDRRDEPHEHLSPVSWHAGATLGSIPTP